MPLSDRDAASMAIAENILVTGGSGTVGRAVVQALRAAGTAPLVASRDGSSVGEVRFDFLDRASWDLALSGVSRLFLLRPPQITDIDNTLGPFVRFARSIGVEHIVFLSVAGAENLSFLPHAKVERYLAETSGWTILRPGFFAQNIETAYAGDIRFDNRIYVPVGRGKVAFVDARDIGEATAGCRLRPDLHSDTAYGLTGPVAVTFMQVADRLSFLLNRQISYKPASIIGYLTHLRAKNEPWSKAIVQTALHVGLRFGQAAGIAPDLAQMIPKKPRSIFDYLDDYHALWK